MLYTVASALYIIKISTVSMVTDAIVSYSLSVYMYVASVRPLSIH